MSRIFCQKHGRWADVCLSQRIVEMGEGKFARASSLPIGRYCGEAIRLQALHGGSSRASLIGTAFHAGAASAEDRAHAAAYHDAMQLIDEEDRFAVAHMIEDWRGLRQERWKDRALETEVTLALDEFGSYTEDLDSALIVGHADAALVEDGVAIVLDHKTGQERDYSYQLAAYALAWASKSGVERAQWGCIYHELGKAPRVVMSEVQEPEALEDWWRKIKAIAQKERKAEPGPWCDGCFVRRHCQAHMAPALELAHDAIRPFTRAGTLTRENAPRALRVIKAMRDAADLGEEILRSAAREWNGIRDGQMVWKPTTVQGRRSVSMEKAAAAGMLDALAKAGALNEGKSYERWSWVKVK